MANRSSKILTSADEIKEFMGISDIVLQHFLRMGLPILQINRRWYAHADNLEEFVRMISRRQNRLNTSEDDLSADAIMGQQSPGSDA